MALRLCRAVDHLQQNQISHRDVKPDNVLLGGDVVHTPLGDRPAVLKLADFGEAQDFQSEGLEGLRLPFITKKTSKGGAQYYLAPEIVQGKCGPTTVLDYEKNDAWAVGMVAYEMLSAEAPPFAVGDDARSFTDESFRELPGCYCSLSRMLVRAFTS